MADLAAGCAHDRLEPWEPDRTALHPRGWRCEECGAAGPTVLRAVTTALSPVRAAILGSCVCGEGDYWPPTEIGAVVGRWLAKHAGCKPEVAERGIEAA